MARQGEAENSRRLGCQMGEIPAAGMEIAWVVGESGVNMAVKSELQGVRVVLWDVFDFTIVLYALNYHVNPGGTFVPGSEHVIQNLCFHNQFRREWGRLGFSTERGVKKSQVVAVEGVVPCSTPLGDKPPQGLTFCNRKASVASFNEGIPDWNGLRVSGLIDHHHRRHHKWAITVSRKNSSYNSEKKGIKK